MLAEPRFQDARFGPAELKQEAVAIANRLVADEWQHGDKSTWLARNMIFPIGFEPKDRPTVSFAGPDFHNGTAGIAVFLLEMALATGSRQYQAAAERAARFSASQIHRVLFPQRFGFYVGLGGVLWAVHRLAIATEAAEWARCRTQILDYLHKTRTQEKFVDLMMGNASGIPLLLRIAEDGVDDPRLTDLAHHLAKELVEKANIRGRTASWTVLKPGKHTPDITGFSHGTAGMMWGLAHAARRWPDERFGAVAMGALEYERSQFDPQEQTWRDLRNEMQPDEPFEPSISKVWCYGPPGMGLGRLPFLQLPGDRDRLVGELRTARARTIDCLEAWSKVPGQDACMCHGLAGNSDAAWIMGDALGDDASAAVNQKWASWGLNRYGQHTGIAWPSLAVHGQAVGMMTGASGVGLWLLRTSSGGKQESPLMPPAPRRIPG